jgi:ABC-type dipeptide/oligopeptide/nickel transport system permease subunit
VRVLSTRTSKIRFELRRFYGFLKTFARSKRGMLGLTIIAGFVIVAICAPIVTPYDPVSILVTPKIAYKLSKPVWYKYLFPNENISENVDVTSDPYFKSADAIDKLSFETSSAGQSSLHTEYISDNGFPEGSGPGCMAIVFSREASVTPYGEVKASLTATFNYPYSFPPKQFLGQIAFMIDNPQNQTIRVNVVLEKTGSGRRITWSSDSFKIVSGGWVIPYPPINSANPDTTEWLGETFGGEWSEFPEKMMFSDPGEYKFGAEIVLEDTQSGASNVTVYLDDFFMRIYGNSFGLLGTDQYQRDIFTQLVYGARISLVIGLLTALFTTIIGLTVGLVAGYVGGIVDQILMRFTDMLLVIPDTPLYIVLMAVLNPSIWTLVTLMTMIGWTGFARISRSQALSLKERPFVEAARALGGGRLHIILRHILPNVMSLVYVALATAVPSAIINEAWLSFLGLYDPTTMTWGRMLEGMSGEAEGILMWWWIIPPGLCIAAISLSFILIGYALDDILNPKLRERR